MVSSANPTRPKTPAQQVGSMANLWPETSPCTVACPIHTDAQGYVSLIAQGRYADALNLIRETNPLPSVLALVCAHPCETKCRRAKVDAPVAICALKRVAVERGQGGLKSPEPRAKLDKKVAVIGGGPSGLTAAYDLALIGYQVTVFEKNEEVGGALRYGIPVYRLPREDVDRDLQEFKKLGVQFKTGVNVGKDITLESIKSQYDAVLISVGLSVSRGLPIPGADLPEVYLALPFLADAAAGRCAFGPGKNVVVVGGGNVAFDVARSAARLGAKKVKMACLEARHEMPAWPWEIEEAIEEGIELNPAWGPKRILGQDGKVVGLEVVKVKSVFDAERRFNPTFYDDQLMSLDGDVVILAIGQGSDLSLAKDTGVELTPRGLLVFDKSKMSTSQTGVFASGEVVTGPGAAVDAMANGRLAAKAIDRYLASGSLEVIAPDNLKAVGELNADTLARIPKEERTPMPMVPPAARIKSFEQIELGYGEDAAIHEAQRCLLCAVGAQRRVQVCANCLTCVRICPFGVPIATSRGVEIRLDQCQSCGICATRCPGEIITLKHFSREEIMARVKAILGDAKTTVEEAVLFGFVCRYYSGQAHLNGKLSETLRAEGIRMLELPCSGRIDILHVMAAFEMGADGVFVTRCGEGTCHFVDGGTYGERVVKQAKGLLEAAGIGANRVEMVMLSSHEPEELGAKAREARERLLSTGPSPLRKRS